jgi:hypothetical protein
MTLRDRWPDRQRAKRDGSGAYIPFATMTVVPGRIARWVLVAGLVCSICCAATGVDRAIAGTKIPCDLTLKVGSRFESPPGQFHANLVFANADYPRCRVSGWPDVELIGPDYPLFGTIYVLPQQAGKQTSVLLGAGKSAHAVLTWLPSSLAPRARWTPGYVRVAVSTDAGPSFPMAVRWPFGSVERQDGATHPGTYIGPIGRGTG